jgi:hypothetical protein
MQDFEKLGLFYLGKPVDPATGTTLEEPVLYDSRDLVTHAVCVGMTGSGKTGLCLNLIEEALIDGIPVIAIDPKGDLGNLLLTFPGLTAEEFAPWIDPDEARRQDKTPQAYAADEARRWKEGLAAWGQDGARIERLRAAAEFAIYTPGSTAGRRVSILSSFAAPKSNELGDTELLVERAGTIAASLLTLAGAPAEPRSREHTLLTTLLTSAWGGGRDMDLPALIGAIQSPPIQKIGVLDLESFFPAKERFELARQMNGLLAAPGFEQWLEGEPLDPAALLHTAEGRPRAAIFSIAHLNDGERMFFVSLLLNQLVSWMRRQTGTSSLRAMVFMDEILGYFPPVANPPSKAPLLTILKQGRAFGIGAVLATQNPVDLDYKGLGNTGTWFLGRMQTDRDKQRVLDGLESAAAGGVDRAEADRLLSGLGKRVFLMHNVHESHPILFQTRWTMSYLRGPLSRDQIRMLRPSSLPAPEQQSAAAPSVAPPATVPPAAATRAVTTGERPLVPPGIPQYFVPAPGSSPADYEPVILGAAHVAFSDSKLKVSETRTVLYSAPVTDGPIPVDWNAAARLDDDPSALRTEPAPDSRFAAPPPAALNPKSYAAWQKDFARFLAQNERVELLRDSDLALTSHLDESEREFRIRLQEAQREARDQAVDALRKKYAAKQAQLQDRIRRAEANVEKESQQASQAKLQTAVSFGATVLGALFGRKAASVGSLGRATTAARGVGRSMKESEDIKRASESLEAVRAQASELEEEIRKETEAIALRYAGERSLDRIELTPKRGQVAVQFVALGWMPSGLAR